MSSLLPLLPFIFQKSREYGKGEVSITVIKERKGKKRRSIHNNYREVLLSQNDVIPGSDVGTMLEELQGGIGRDIIIDFLDYRKERKRKEKKRK